MNRKNRLACCTKNNIILIFKNNLPTWLVERVRNYRKNKRFLKRFSYNEGKPFFKKIEVVGVAFDIMINPFLNSGVDDVIAETGFWEQKLSHDLKKFLPKDGVFVDIGANIGYHSLFAAKLLDCTGHVYSFEPQNTLSQQLQESIKINGFRNITVFNTALSDHTGEDLLRVREENIGGSTLLNLPKMESFRVDTVVRVPLTTLDSYGNIFQRVDVIKIDVEGYEYEVFKGGEKIIEKYRPVILMEFSPVFYIQDYAEKPHELIFFLEEKGYKFFTLDGVPINLISWMHEKDNMFGQIDVVCVAV